jgi:hypothetical protein
VVGVVKEPAEHDRAASGPSVGTDRRQLNEARSGGLAIAIQSQAGRG